MPMVDVRTLADPILIRLHLVSEKLMTDQEAGEVTDWGYIARVTENELARRGLRTEDVRGFETLDTDAQRSRTDPFASVYNRKTCRDWNSFTRPLPNTLFNQDNSNAREV